MASEFTDEQWEYLKDLLTPRCCHVTGIHDPTHFKEQRYICDIQKARAFDRARKLLGFPGIKPEDVIPEDDCYWCNRKEE